MDHSKTPSLRSLSLILVGATLAVFSVVCFFIFHAIMPRMLLQTEYRYLERQLDLVSTLFEKTLRHTRMAADDISAWEETVLFARGKNPGYIADNWPNNSLLEKHNLNFAYIKDRDGRTLYMGTLDHATGESIPMPAEFSSLLNTLSGQVLAMYEDAASLRRDTADLGKSGIIYLDGTAYSLTVMPILALYENGRPEGVFVLGSILTNEYFRELTHYRDSFFEIYPAGKTPGTETSLFRENGDLITETISYEDINGQPLLLRMGNTRLIYNKGHAVLNTAFFILVATLAAFALVLYWSLNKGILTPLARLSKDITALDRNRLDPKKYSNSKEFTRLSGSINDMLTRLEQSNVSMDSMQRVLNGVDAYIYVTDPETDRILFVNDRLAEHFGTDKNLEGKKCWEILQPGMTGKCPFCPLHELQESGCEESVVVWEDHSPITDRYYRRTDCLIQWGWEQKRAHLQHAVDITDAKTAEVMLKKRFEQQELMSAMSQSFISGMDTPTLINNALEMAGSFLDVSKILVAKLDHETLVAVHEWYNPYHDCYQPEETALPFHPGTPEYDAFITGKKPLLAIDDLTLIPGFDLAASHGLRAVAGVPLFIGGSLWGLLSFGESLRPRQWSESDTHLMKLIGSVISGVVLRQTTEDELVRMSSIVNSSPQFISYVNPEGDFEYVNPGTLYALGYSREELTNFRQIFDDESCDILINDIIPRILEEETCSFELPVRCKDGRVKIMSFSAFKAGSSSVEGIGAIALDITEMRLLEKELVAAKDLAEQSSRAKSEFLSRMSHEMRTPLNAIIGMTNIAKSSKDAAKKEYCLEKIDDASSHLLGVINDILDMSKIAANKFELSPSEFNFEKVLMSVINVVNFRVDEKSQILMVNIDRDMPLNIVSDEQRLTQVLTNLLSNAVKFTPEGGTITLTTRLLGQDDEGCDLQVEVTDTGIGITEEQRGRLFHSFEQADGGISRKFGGTGLGLAISKSIIELMGGRIWVESEPDAGSTFAFTIRVGKGKSPAKPLLDPSINWGNLRVLVVDDAPEVRDYFLNFAEHIGLFCHVAEDGPAACRIIENNLTTPYHLVFVDWKMPGMNGIELTRKIKKSYGSEMVVIMISATQWNDIESEAKAAGVDHFVPKPLFSSHIVSCINQCLGLQQLGKDAAAKSLDDESDCFAGCRVLLAEDIDINREIVLSMLEHTGLAIDTAEDGRAACEMFEKNSAAYDLILMDIHMPEVDGYEATRRIRSMGTPKSREIPIVAMTANVFKEDIERCLAAGMDDHIGKPVDVAALMDKLHKRLPRTPARDKGGESPA